jgi:gliding motility-associated lipoprotein GldH
MSQLKWIWMLAVVLVLGACGNNVVFQQTEVEAEEGWAYTHPFSFTYNVTDTAALHNLIFDVRVTPDYGYQNLWLYIETNWPDGSVYYDSVNCPMAYPTGEWVGTSAGELIDTPVLLRQKFKFDQLGDVTIKIKHGMRYKHLPHVKNVGIIIKQVDL